MSPSMHGQNSWNPARTVATRLRLARQLMLVATTLLVALTGCLPPSSIDHTREDRLKQYEAIVRWSEWDGAVSFLAPEYLEEHPISHLEMERLQMFKVTNYTTRAFAVYDDGMTAVQTVDIKMYNSTQAVERTISDEQVWRFDPELKTWLLYSGLPDPTKRH